MNAIQGDIRNELSRVASSHLSHTNAQTRSSTATRPTRHTYHHLTCQNKPNNFHQNVDGRYQNVHELYFILQKDMVSKAKSVGDDSWKRRRIICKATFAILCSRDCVRCSNRIRVLAEKSYQAKKMLKHVFWSFGPCMNGFAYDIHDFTRSIVSYY